jgi:hypothetical protein
MVQIKCSLLHRLLLPTSICTFWETTAERAGLDRLNRRGHTGARAAWSSLNDTLQIRVRFSVSHLVRACYSTLELRVTGCTTLAGVSGHS